MRLNQDRLRELLLLTGLCGFFFFFRLSGIGLLGPDEPRYAQVAREMLARHDWVTPVLYGHIWLEKPILLYWCEMISYRAFGISDWAARVPSAVAATGLAFGTFVMVRRIRFAARLDAALAVASSVLVLGFARAAATDMLLAAPFGLSLLAWFCWYRSEPGRFEEGDELSQPEQSELPHTGLAKNANLERGTGASRRYGSRRYGNPWLVLFYALNALAMLAKGPVAPGLAALVLIGFCALDYKSGACKNGNGQSGERRLRALWRTLDPIGIAAFIAIAAPWYLLVQLRNPEFFRVFFLEHNLARFGSNLYRHRQPFWYYVPVALAATVPWTVWALQGLADGLRGSRIAEAPVVSRAVVSQANGEPDYGFEIFLSLWALIPIAFFSLSHSKLPGYILPSIPALVILAAVAVHRRAGRGERPGRFAIAAHAVLLAAVAAALWLAPQLALKLPVSAPELMIAAFAGTAVLLMVALPLLVAGWPSWRFVTLLPIVLGVGFILRGLAPALDATQSARPVAAILEQMEARGDLRADNASLPAAGAGDNASLSAAGAGELPVATFALNRNTAFGLGFYLNRMVAPYEGLEISPAVYELPPGVPSSAHILVTRKGSLPALGVLLGNRRLRWLGSYRPQNMEIYEVAAAR